MPLPLALFTTLALALVSLASHAGAPDTNGKPAVEIVNKTQHPLNVYKGRFNTVVLPDEKLQTEDFKTSTITIATSTPKAAIRFVTLSHAKGCQAATCVLITGE